MGLPLSDEFLFLPAALVNHCHGYAGKAEAGAQVFAPEHVVHVCHSIELQGLEPCIQSSQTSQSFVVLEVHSEGLHVRGHPVEERGEPLAGEEGDGGVGILSGKVMNHGNEHGYVAHG